MVPRKRLLNVAEAAEYLGTTAHTLYEWARDRRVPSFKQGKSVRFDLHELDKYVERMKKGK